MGENNGSEVMSFLNLFNEFYSRDTSKKVKSVRKACAESGKYLGTYAPFGYKKDPANKHYLLIDEDYAPIVRRMFHLRGQGQGYRAIAIILNEEGILPPGVLYYHKKGMADPRNVNHKWAETTVKSIIRNEVYIGSMVQGKSGTFSYKSRKLIAKPEEDWIRVENTHEPIIGLELWNIVQELDRKKMRKRPTSQGNASIFTGLVHCADCGFKMRFHTENGKHKDGSAYCYASFICGNYGRSGKSACSVHTIYENVLIQLVVADIREKARYVKYDEQQIIDSIMRLKDKETKSQLSSYEQELRVQSARQRELENLMQNLYEDKVSGTIPETVFKTLIQKYEKERADKAAAIPALEEKIKSGRQVTNDAAVWANIIKRYAELETLDTSILYELVDRIEVGETQKIDGKRICDIRVCYRYVGNIDGALLQDVEVRHDKAV